MFLSLWQPIFSATHILKVKFDFFSDWKGKLHYNKRAEGFTWKEDNNFPSLEQPRLSGHSEDLMSLILTEVGRETNQWLDLFLLDG